MDLGNFEVPFLASHQSVVCQKPIPKTIQKFATSALNPTLNGSNYEDEIIGNFITKGELAQLLKVSVSFVEKLMADGGLPYFKIGRSVRFRYEEVREWLLRRRFP